MNDECMNIVIVGHVDHGKSTLMGCLLAKMNALPQGKLERVKQFCEMNARPFEYAFLLDALGDEQTQGITIDIARCFFSTQTRRYLILDAPGHIEFLKNLVTGAASAEAAFLVIDASEKIQENTKRHAYMLALLDVKQVVVLVNKMDLVNYSEVQFNEIKSAFTEFLEEINLKPISYIPVCGRQGDNIVAHSDHMPWYEGLTMVETLDGFVKKPSDELQPFRMHVQDVYKFTNEKDNRRIIAGQMSSGTLQVGDHVLFSPSGKTSRVKSLEAFNRDTVLNTVSAGYSIGFTLHEQIYVKRGDIVSRVGESVPYTATLIQVSLFWLGKNPLIQDKEYIFKLGTYKTRMILGKIKHRMDTATLSSTQDATHIGTNQAGECTIRLFEPMAFDPNHVDMQRFVIVDEFDIAGGGIILSHLEDEHTQDPAQHTFQNQMNPFVDYGQRCEYYQQKGQIIWFTGLSGAGKTTLASLLEYKLLQAGRVTCLLDGDSLRNSLNVDLGFSEESRRENIRRLGEIAILMATQSMIVLVSAISPHEDMRQIVREKAALLHIDFTEIYLSASIETCQRRDPKGLYKAVKRGHIDHFTGISSLYEAPKAAEIILDTERHDLDVCMSALTTYFKLHF